MALLSTATKEATRIVIDDPLKTKAEEEFISTKVETPISIILMLGLILGPTK